MLKSKPHSRYLQRITYLKDVRCVGGTMFEKITFAYLIIFVHLRPFLHKDVYTALIPNIRDQQLPMISTIQSQEFHQMTLLISATLSAFLSLVLFTRLRKVWKWGQIPASTLRVTDLSDYFEKCWKPARIGVNWAFRIRSHLATTMHLFSVVICGQ